MGAGQALLRFGLTNAQSDDLSGYIGESRRQVAMFCSSNSCGARNGSYKGTLVYVGFSSKKRCPKCNSSAFLFFEKVNDLQAENLLQKLTPMQESRV